MKIALSMQTEKRKAETYDILFLGLLVYTIIFYSQIGARFPLLGHLRIELLVGSIMLILITLEFLKGQINLHESSLNILACVFLLVTVITIPLAYYKTYAYQTFIRLFKVFTIYLMIITGITSEKKFKIFIYIYLSMACLLFVEPFLLSLQGKGFVYNNHMWRLAGVTGLFAHPNSLSAITSSTFPFFYYLMLQEKSILRKLPFLLLIAIGLRVIMLTQSRTGFVGVMAFVFVIWLQSKRKLLLSIIIMISLAIAWQLAPAETKARFLTLQMSAQVITSENLSHLTAELDDYHDYGSMIARWTLIKRSIAIFLEHPILGVGLGNFVVESFREYNRWIPTHCLYTEVLAELGIMGFCLFICIIVKTLLNLKETKLILKEVNLENSFLDRMASAVIAFLYIRLIVGFFSHSLVPNFWWLAGGLSVLLLRVAINNLPRYPKI